MASTWLTRLNRSSPSLAGPRLLNAVVGSPVRPRRKARKRKRKNGQGRTALTGQLNIYSSGEPRMSITTQQLLQILPNASS
jgi:hypothetical protein